jgi:hypothetical protein
MVRGIFQLLEWHPLLLGSWSHGVMASREPASIYSRSSPFESHNKSIDLSIPLLKRSIILLHGINLVICPLDDQLAKTCTQNTLITMQTARYELTPRREIPLFSTLACLP